MACASAAPAAPGGSPGAGTAARFLTYNIHHGAGGDDCTTPPAAPGAPPNADCGLDLERIAAVIRAEQVDVAGLQEVDRFWGRSGMVDQAAHLGILLGMQTCYGANLSHPPDTHSAAAHEYGTLILSRHPIVSCDNTLLPRAGPTSEQRGLLMAAVRVGGTLLRFSDTHLHTQEADRRLQVDAIIRQLGTLAGPVVLVGDLNARPTESYLAPLFAILRDVWPLAGLGSGFTSPARPGQQPTSRIDYILVSPAISVTGAATVVGAATAIASDHYPVTAHVVVPAAGVARLSGGRQPAIPES